MKYQRHSDGEIVDGFPHRMDADAFTMLEQFIDGRTVIPLREISDGNRSTDTVGMRHDVDHNLEHAVKFARWEAQRGWSSTYFLLHTAWYFDLGDDFTAQAFELEELGHEVGIHNNAVAIARDAGDDPLHARALEILTTAVEDLRGLGLDIVGSAAHGDHRCDTYNVHNNDLWKEQGGLYQLSDVGLEYEAYFLHRPNWYISDSGGRWEPPLPLAHHETKQTSMLIHPCHWDIDAVA